VCLGLEDHGLGLALNVVVGLGLSLGLVVCGLLTSLTVTERK